ncbi:MAG: LysR family transcriptional regulator [Ewingella americana]|uniref:LysR family transcriptional regulator n=1 Tax=Ewingella americana TaxID=41202 RepID=UPI0024302061|nr:LysR family transcriptional regulator [Ewingella americana]MCI1678143.1 LysR family transcriptional regulator [Ewingella americana]MCI1856220.1 LysR family transcriptional regulator [Ewingella americana]MCI1862445.1 LysR family transcriptional regulator [Ewingella americana]MCI2162393.1 LysR family transcriptional regulator [Ewingella americana]MCI2209158.1 LysR family transcriptional regulator [Ewingella americana]
MLNLQRLEMYVAVVAAGSFTAAANTLGLTKAVVSFNIKQLENELGVALLTRSTRRIAMTDAGERFYLRCLQLLQDAESVLDDVRRDHSGLQGLLRITTTPEYGARVVVPALAAFSLLHPQLRVQHVSSSNHDDLISGRFDVAIRLGQLADSSHHAALIDRFDILPVASPDYLQQWGGYITDLTQLEQARWIAHSRLNTPLTWQVLTPAGESVLFNAGHSPMLMADSASSLHAFALNGAGIALLPAWLVESDIVTKKLTHLLPDHRFPPQGIYALYPNTRHVPEKVRAFIDFLQRRVAG